MTDKEKPNCINIKKFPWQITLYKNDETYSLQKTFYAGNRMNYPKLSFKLKDIKSLAYVLFHCTRFRNEFKKFLTLERKQKKIKKIKEKEVKSETGETIVPA